MEVCCTIGFVCNDRRLDKNGKLVFVLPNSKMQFNGKDNDGTDELESLAVMIHDFYKFALSVLCLPLPTHISESLKFILFSSSPLLKPFVSYMLHVNCSHAR